MELNVTMELNGTNPIEWLTALGMLRVSGGKMKWEKGHPVLEREPTLDEMRKEAREVVSILPDPYPVPQSKRKSVDIDEWRNITANYPWVGAVVDDKPKANAWVMISGPQDWRAKMSMAVDANDPNKFSKDFASFGLDIWGTVNTAYLSTHGTKYGSRGVARLLIGVLCALPLFDVDWEGNTLGFDRGKTTYGPWNGWKSSREARHWIATRQGPLNVTRTNLGDYGAKGVALTRMF